MQRYPAKFDPDDGGFVVTFRDIPEAITQGDTIEEAREAARDALLTAMDFYFEDGRAVPAPSKAQAHEELVDLPLSAVAKILLLNEMVASKTRPADLARAMGVTRQEVTRLTDLEHTTKVDTLEQAFAALGKRLDLRVLAA